MAGAEPRLGLENQVSLDGAATAELVAFPGGLEREYKGNPASAAGAAGAAGAVTKDNKVLQDGPASAAGLERVKAAGLERLLGQVFRVLRALRVTAELVA